MLYDDIHQLLRDEWLLMISLQVDTIAVIMYLYTDYYMLIKYNKVFDRMLLILIFSCLFTTRTEPVLQIEDGRSLGSAECQFKLF